MNVRCVPILQQLQRTSFRSFRVTPRRFFSMEGGVTIQEMEEALKERLSATHTQINDISGTSSD
jgi:hypothetical protein